MQNRPLQVMWSGEINNPDLHQPEATHLKAERIGIVQSGEEKASGQPNFGLLFHERSLQERWKKETFCKHV